MSAAGYARSLRSTLRHPLAADTALLTAAQYAGAVIGFAEAAFVAWMLGPAQYGLFALAIAYPALVWSFSSVKSSPVTTRYISQFRAQGARQKLASICKLGFAIDAGIACLAALLTAASAWVVSSWFYRQPALAPWMALYAASLPFASLTTTSTAVLSSFQRLRALSLLGLLEKMVSFGLMAAFLLAGRRFDGAVMGIACAQAITGVAMLFAAHRCLVGFGAGNWLRARFSRLAETRAELKNNLFWNYLNATVSGVYSQAPIMALARVAGAEAAGFYRLALTVATAAGYVETTVARVAYPLLASQIQRLSAAELRRKVRRWTFSPGIPLAAVIALGALLTPWIVPRVFGAGFTPAILAVQVMLIAGCASALLFWLNSVYFASGQIHVWTRWNAVQAITLLAAGSALSLRMGVLGMAIGFAVAKLLFTAALGWQMLRREPRG